VTGFIAYEDLGAVVVCSLGEFGSTEFLRASIEEAGLGDLVVNYLSFGSPSAIEGSEKQVDLVTVNILANVARLDHAHHIKDTVLRTVSGTSKISRRSLLRSIPRMLRVESEIPIVLSNRCGNRSDTCHYCRDACPVNALLQNGGTTTIDDRRCIECGACARDCPIGAIQPPTISDAQIMAMLNTLSTAELGTSKCALLMTCPIGSQRLLGEDKNGMILEAGLVPTLVPCVAAIGSVHYLWSASVGVGLITVCPDASCRKAPATLPMHAHVDSCRRMLGATGQESNRFVEHLSLTEQDSILDAILSTMELPTKRSTKLRGFYRRDATLDALRILDLSAGETLPADTPTPFFDMTVDAMKCTYCELCRMNCPDQAIEFSDNEGAFALMFDPMACGGCMICEKSCPENAIRVSRLQQPRFMLEGKKLPKAQDESVKCRGCGAPIGSARTIMALERKLAEQGLPDALVEKVRFCVQCKQRSLVPVESK
jgi:ferredoxin